MSTAHTIVALCQRSRDISLEKGWLNPDGTDPRPFHTVTSLFHTELSEAFEDIRSNKGLQEIYYEVNYSLIEHDEKTRVGSASGGKRIMGLKELNEMKAKGAEISSAKPCGIPVELADFVIRVAQYYGSAGRGLELSNLVEATCELPTTEKIENAEELVTLLHLDVSFAFAAERGALKGSPTLSQDPLVYHGSALVTVFDFCKKNDINIWAAIDEKEAYNRTRPQKHGGKKM